MVGLSLAEDVSSSVKAGRTTPRRHGRVNHAIRCPGNGPFTPVNC